MHEQLSLCMKLKCGGHISWLLSSVFAATASQVGALLTDLWSATDGTEVNAQ